MTQGVIKRGMVAFVIFGAVYAHANDDVDITLNSALNLNSQISDGQLIGYGRISTQQAHSGYQVWLNAERNGESPDRYVLTGKSNRQHKLYVIIGQNGWVPDNKGGEGIIKRTREMQEQFDIVANGHQSVPVDTYVITVQGRYFEP
ncbi:invasin [Salmonella enterica subsp. enterica serovar Montevideo]|nr:invasin [Salmonella enterica subsp. enterica serovar Duisburg]EBX2192280.1 invasin [Salmonella enterica subsp. enterica serovar Duisburg]ECB3039422.1 invasin [Salmonella enterica subsp. enterica serovar Duisburg]EDH0227665.1 invasin [Salmonella enterica subsp. enterica serovar Montevideo]